MFLRESRFSVKCHFSLCVYFFEMKSVETKNKVKRAFVKVLKYTLGYFVLLNFNYIFPKINNKSFHDSRILTFHITVYESFPAYIKTVNNF